MRNRAAAFCAPYTAFAAVSHVRALQERYKSRYRA